MNNTNDDATSAGVFYTLQLAFGGDPCLLNSLQYNVLNHITYIAKKYFLVYLLPFPYEIEFNL